MTRRLAKFRAVQRLEWRSFVVLGAVSLAIWVFFTLVSESFAF